MQNICKQKITGNAKHISTDGWGGKENELHTDSCKSELEDRENVIYLDGATTVVMERRQKPISVQLINLEEGYMPPRYCVSHELTLLSKMYSPPLQKIFLHV
jgi:hypothetical protein